jgi:3-hydroxyacyl-CoA dehydrogenase
VAPERVVVGPPRVPAHLLPLVEIVGSDATEELALDWSARFYERVGKRPLRLRRKCEGYVANRLQRALFDEAIRLVESGVCTFEDIDAAVTNGFALRNAVVGPVLHRHLAGGRGGVRRMLEHFGWRGSEQGARDLSDAIERRWGGVPVEDLKACLEELIVRILWTLRAAP